MVRSVRIILIVLFIIPAVFAGTTGKIAGMVKDRQTGERRISGEVRKCDFQLLSELQGTETDAQGVLGRPVHHLPRLHSLLLR